MRLLPISLLALVLAGCLSSGPAVDDDDTLLDDDDSAPDDDDIAPDDDDIAPDDDDSAPDDDDIAPDDDDIAPDDDDSAPDDDDSAPDDDDSAPDDDDTLPDDDDIAPIDADGDGYPAGEDCDDSDPATFPGNGWDEPSDLVDNDCGAGTDTSLAWAHAFVQGAPGDQAGTSVAFAGDVDGDGLDDVIVGVPLHDFAFPDAGAVYLLLGSTLAGGGTFDAATADLLLTGTGPDDHAGSSVAPAGDVDGDGLDDIIVGAPGRDAQGQDSGEAYVVLGAILSSAASPLSLATAGVVLGGDDDGDRAGAAVAPAGDVDGDGLDDVLVGAWGSDNGRGAAYVILGTTLAAGGPLPLSDADVILEGENNSQAGWSVASAGDVDGDGLGDLLVGAPGQGTYPASPGYAHLVLGAELSAGQDELELMDAHATFECPNAGTDCGLAVSSAGDVDGDGLDDVMLSTLTTWGPTGHVYLFMGQTLLGGGNLQVAAAWLHIEGDANGDLAGHALSSGDVDADGLGDILVGVPLHDSLVNDVGSAALAYGAFIVGGTEPMGGAFDEAFRDDLAGDESGRAVASGGDVDGDGRDDLLVGAPHHGADAGRAVLLLSP